MITRRSFLAASSLAASSLAIATSSQRMSQAADSDGYIDAHVHV